VPVRVAACSSAFRRLRRARCRDAHDAKGLLPRARGARLSILSHEAEACRQSERPSLNLVDPDSTQFRVTDHKVFEFV